MSKNKTRPSRESPIMSNSFMSKIRLREEKLTERWKGIADRIPVNVQQYSFDSPERQEGFLRAQFPTTAEWEKYEWYRAEWYRRAKEFDPGDAPLSVGIELVSTCNLGCSMCYTITEEFQNSIVGGQRMLPWEIVKAIIDEAAELNVPSILFSWRGESTLYRQTYQGKTYCFPDALAYAREKGILEIGSLTHGQHIDLAMAEALVEAEPSWISISIDGMGDTYNQIRTPVSKKNSNYNAFEIVCKNIRQLVALRNAKGKTRPQIRTNTVYPAIARDPSGYYEHMIKLGVGWVTVNEILDFRGSGIDADDLPEEGIIQDWACQYPFQRLMVSANGIILPCTGAHNEESGLVLGRFKGTPPKVIRNVDGKIATIDAFEQTLKQAWTEKKLSLIRKIHQEGKRKTIRPGCRNCRHGAVKHGVSWIPEDWNTETMEWKGHKWRNG